ncbi:MAG TPA: pyridoxamine 5'-phosphate oxidase [Acidimicrobiia bacterium]
MNLEDLHDDYDTPGLEASELGADPVAAAAGWLQEAIDAAVPQANAMSLATADATGKPSVRTVLLKEVDTGFVFYSNYRSRKGDELEQNPHAAGSLTWVTIHRQVRFAGPVERVDDAMSDAYWATRPRGAQIAAAASDQSRGLSSRAELERRVADLEARHPGAVPRPADWGGYRIVPRRIEFWQGRRNRLHDRIEYRRDGGIWSARRLAP